LSGAERQARYQSTGHSHRGAALRSGVAGIVLLPVVLRRGLALDRLDWGGLALMIAALVIIGWHAAVAKQQGCDSQVRIGSIASFERRSLLVRLTPNTHRES
jgi:hypothetical protein